MPHIAPNTPIRFELFGKMIFLFGADLVNMLIALIMFGAIVAFVKFTKGGIAIRATAEDQSTAYSMGISVPKVFSRAWGSGLDHGGDCGRHSGHPQRYLTVAGAWCVCGDWCLPRDDL